MVKEDAKYRKNHPSPPSQWQIKQYGIAEMLTKIKSRGINDKIALWRCLHHINGCIHPICWVYISNVLGIYILHVGYIYPASWVYISNNSSINNLDTKY